MRGKTLYIALGALIAGATLYLLLESSSLKEALMLWRSVGARGVIPAFLLYFATYVLKAERWRVLLPRELERWELLRIVAFHTALANTLPAKLGEIAFPLLLKRKGMSFILSGSLLLLVRGIDALCLMSLLLLSFKPLWGLALISFEFAFTFFGFKTIERSLKLLLTVPKLREVYSRGWQRFQREEMLKSLGLTYLIWGIKVIGIASLLTSSGRVDFLTAFKGAIGAECSFIIPISGFLGLGNYEMGWIVASGTKLEEAFFAHSFLIISSLLIALICSLTSLKTSSTDMEDMQGRTP